MSEIHCLFRPDARRNVTPRFRGTGSNIRAVLGAARVSVSIVPRLFLDWCSIGARFLVVFCRCEAVASSASRLHPSLVLTVLVGLQSKANRIPHFTFASRSRLRLNAARESAPLFRRSDPDSRGGHGHCLVRGGGLGSATGPRRPGNADARPDEGGECPVDRDPADGKALVRAVNARKGSNAVISIIEWVQK